MQLGDPCDIRPYYTIADNVLHSDLWVSGNRYQGRSVTKHTVDRLVLQMDSISPSDDEDRLDFRCFSETSTITKISKFAITHD